MLRLEVTQVVRDIGETAFVPYGLSASAYENFTQETFPQTTCHIKAEPSTQSEALQGSPQV